ncbi:alpha/beta fold hydrolase [Nocardiopsis mangrovi]|uniref:Alpha/beta fold hydrolase n=1 Tax=Nocardiopsis mangrovi TaxID=1179818 RepID=A0ABV9DWT5_9ACTN
MTWTSDAIEAAGPRGGHGGRDVRQRTGTTVPAGGAGEQAEEGDGTVRHFTVRHDGVTIAVSRGGRGRPLVLCPGLNTTQAELRELTGLLRRDHDVITFDLRGHGLSSAADRYAFAGFLGDLAAVLADPGRLGLRSAPVLVGYSLGADLAVHHASEFPGTFAGLVLIDGANPLPEPFIAEADLAEFRALAEDLAKRHEAERGAPTARTVLLTAQDIFALQLEIDVVRAAILDRHRRIDRPVSMIMSTSIAGGGTEGRTQRHNRLWRSGIERLVGEVPHASATWLDADHRLPFTHAPEVARIIRDLPG